MASELDHLFVCTDPGAPAAADLVALGLTEGGPNVHPGQGTANRRFFFRNAMLELLWVREPDEARSAGTRPTGLWERWSGRDDGITCPFGLCLRPAGGGTDRPPFDTWGYRPPYLPEGRVIEIATSAAILTEPMLFHLPFGRRPDAYPPATRQPMEHAVGLREVTRVRWVRPGPRPATPELTAVVRAGRLGLGDGRAHALEIGFDGESQGRSVDLGPRLPLVLAW